MRIVKNLQILSILILLLSCTEKNNTTKYQKQEVLEPNIDLNTLKTDFIKWWVYYSDNISLSSDFVGLNEKSDTITKKLLLENLITGNYIPLKIKSNTQKDIYKLFKLDERTSVDIRTTIKSQSLTEFKYFKMEGQQFPNFEFVDLNGNYYNNENTRGKTILLKTWFINCAACVTEFPELNDFVDKYKEREDIIFLSLATNNKSDLNTFLQRKNFKYGVVPKQEKFIEKLNLKIYPTHIIIDKKGIIKKVFNEASEMIAFFEVEENKKSLKKLPPPPM